MPTPSEEKAAILRRLKELEDAEKQEAIEQAAAKRRQEQGLSNNATQLAPASPEAVSRDKNKVKNNLLHGNRTNTSAALLKNHRRVQEEAHTYSKGVASTSYSSSSSSSFASSSRHHQQQHTTSATSTSKSDLGSLLAEEASGRIPKRFNEAPSQLLEANEAVRRRLKQNESQRGLAGHRSSRFGEVAPKQQQPTPSYSNHNNRSRQHDNYDFKGKGVERVNRDSSGESSSIMNSRPSLAQERYERENPQLKTLATNGTIGRYDSAAYDDDDDHDGGDNDMNIKRRKIDRELDEYGFSDYHSKEQSGLNGGGGNKRNDDLTIAHDLRPGPIDHPILRDDPKFENVEPNSKIRLKERILPHEDLQEHLSDRYYLSHETLYSIVRPSRGGLEYEVPVEGDWIIIGVLAEKSEIKYTGAGSASNVIKQLEWKKKQEAEKRRKNREAAIAARRKQGQQEGKETLFDDALFDDLAKSDEELNDAFQDSDDGGDRGKKGPNTASKDEDKVAGSATEFRRRYITFKLIDLGQKNAGGGAGVLSLKLFESDPEQRRRTKNANSDDDEEEVHEIINKRTGKRILVKKRKGDARKDKERAENGGVGGVGNNDDKDRFERREYKGGSNGAFEKFWKERDGAVIAILNPRIMKPWTHPSQENNPNANILSITPESADSIIVIGRSKDLGACEAKRKDGNICQAWYDKRMDVPVCDFHREAAIRARRAGRAELLQGTGGFQTSKLSNGDVTAYSRNGLARRSNGREFCGGTVGTSTAEYDPVNKVGLRPRSNVSIQEGSKTFVVSGGGGGSKTQGMPYQGGHRTGMSGVQAPSNTSHRIGGNTRGNSGGLLGAPDWDNKKNLDTKSRREQRERQSAGMDELLSRDGNKTAGAKYLNKNKNDLPSRAHGDTGRKETTKEDSTSHSEHDTDGGVATTVVKTSRKRLFPVDEIRKIGFDPTSLPVESDARQEKRKLEAVRQLGNPDTYEPKLDRQPGAKVRSGVRAPVIAAATGARSDNTARKSSHDVDTVDDWDDLEADVASNSRQDHPSIGDEGEPRKRLCANAATTKNDSGYQASSDADQQRNGIGAGNVDSDDSDLEIDPPLQ